MDECRRNACVTVQTSSCRSHLLARCGADARTAGSSAGLHSLVHSKVKGIVGASPVFLREFAKLPVLAGCDALPGIRAARLARCPEDGLPYFLELDFDADQTPDVGAMVKTLAPYLLPLADRGMPVPLSFERVAAESAWSVTLIANLAPGTPPEDAAPVQRVVLRRDPS